MEQKLRKPVAWLLTLAMLFTMLPSFTFTALAADNLCEHHAEHTAECGYVEGVSDCAYHCDVCLGHDHGDEVTEEDTESAPVCDCGTDDAAIHATTCAVYVAPENPVCYCAEKCTDVNEWCDVCGFDISKCTGTDTAVGYAEGDVASVTVGETTTNYTSLDDALIAAQNNPGSTLTLLQDIDRGSEELMIRSVPDSTFTIDLNGCTLTSTTATGTVFIQTRVNLTVVDSKGTGGIISNNNAFYIDWSGTTVNIIGVTITTTDTTDYEAGVNINASDATVNIIDSTINSKNIGVYGGGTLNISGDTSITGTNLTGVYRTGGALTITGGNITDGVTVYGGTADIIGGTITESREYYSAVEVQNAQVTISGGSISGGKADLFNDSYYPGTIKLTLDEGKTVGATFPGGITAEGITLAELLATDTAAYWGVVDGKDTMLTVAAAAATGITDKGDITIRAICDHKDVKLDYITTETTHTPVCSVCNWTGEATEHTGGTATCQDPAVCEACGVSYGDKDANIHTPTEGTIFTDNGDGTHSYTCACGAAVAEVPHTLDVTTGKCSACGADMTVVATVTDGITTLSASDAATLNQAVTAILETGSRTFTVELPADAEAGMITAIRRAICDTEGVADGSIYLTLKGVTSIPGTTNWDGVAFGPGDIYDEAGEIVDQELVTQLASINLPDVTEIGAQAFYFCENLVSVSAPKAQTIGAQAFGYTALTSVEFPELTTIPTDMFSGTWTLSSAKFPKVTTIEQGGLLVGAKFTPENNPTPFPLELTAEGNITFNGSNHFNIASQNYSGKVDLVLCCDKKDAVTFHDDGTATWQVREDLSYTFKSITFKHSYVNGKCTACGEDCAHTGGTATCTTLAVCDTCGVSYGAVDTTNHDETVAFDSNGFCPNGCYEPATLNAEGYYEIDNAGKLFWFAQQVNVKGNREIKGVLTADIDLENKPWTPIGETGENNNNFRGVFDGQGHTIKGLYVEGGRAGLGFFGEVRTGTVKNFTIYGNVVVNTEVNYVGGVIGSICGLNSTDHGLERNGAIIQNITSFVNVTAKAHGIGMIGGFVGYANHQSLIEQCAWYGTFDAGIYRVDSGAGGFIGKIQEDTSEVTIRNCGAYGTIKTNYAKNSYNNTATIYMGGFLSFSNTDAKTTLENCLFAGRFERGENLTDEARLGAFGTLRSVNAIKNCYYLGDDGLAAVHSDSDLKPGSDNVKITSVTGEELRNNTIATQLGDHWMQDVHYPIPKDTKTHSDSATYTYTDNGDGTHKATCTACGKVEVDNEPHTIENHVCTACGAMEIVVSFNAGDFEWKTGDKLYFCRVSGDNEWEEYAFTATVAGDGTVTWTPDRTLYWDGTGEHKLVVVYPGDTPWAWDRFYVGDDQTTTEKLHEFDLMNAMWSGNPTTDPITLNLKHRLAKVTVNYEIAEGVTVSKAEVYTLTQYLLFDIHTLERKNIAWEEGHDLWINSYHNGNQFTAFVSPDAYAADGNFIKITLSDGSVREVKMNKAVTFEEGAEYTYKVVITADGAYLTCADECTFEYTDNEDGLTHSKVCTECGYVAASENHTLTYISDEDANTITESCSANCGYSASLTLKAPANLVYDRTEKAATVEGEIIADYELTYSADAVIMAGDYTATLTVGDYSVSLAFTIVKADPDVATPTGLTATYGQTLADVELPGGWAWKNSSASVGSVGSNTFAAIYTPANISNFNTLERDLTVVVAKAMPTVTAPVAADDLVYNGTAQTLITAGTATGGTMQYSLDGSIWSETIPTGKDAKTYTVYYKVVGDSNHNDSSVDSVQVTIGKTTLSVKADNKTMTTGQTLPTFTYTITGFVGGETEDVLTAKPTVSCEADGKTAGTYDITVSGAAADNYEITHINGTLSVVDHQHAWTYTAKDDTITATCNAEGCPDAEQSITISAVGKTYDGTPVTATLGGSIDGVATPEITYTGNTNAGTHTASITIEGETASVKFTIEKATVTVTADAKSKPYGTDNPTLTYTSEGLLGDDALTGALETTATKTSNVGEYDITVGSLANSNYTIDFVGAKLTITKAASSCTAPAAVSGLTFNGGNQNLITAGTATGGTMQYSLDGSNWSETIPTGKDADTYTVYYKVVGDGNHNDADGGSVSVTIAPKVITNPVIEGIDAQYLHTGSAITPVPTAVKDGNTVIDPSEYTLAYENNINEGTATLKIVDAANGNYTVSGSKTFQIVVHAHVWNYSASGNTITATCNGNIGTCPVENKTVTIKLNVPDNLSYDGNAKIVTVTQSPAGVFTDIPAVTYGASGNVNAGKHTASLTYGEKTATLEFTIAAATPTVAWDNTTASVEYTGSAASITTPTVTLVNGETFNGTISYSYTGTSSGSGLPTNAGTYEITASIDAQGNYIAATSMNKLTLTITAKNIAAADIAVNGVNASYTYTGNPIQPTVTSVTADGKTLDSNEYEVTYGTNTTVAQGGSVIVKLKGNYSGEKTVTFTILASDQADFSISGATTAVYGGNSIELTATGGSGTGTITWEITSGSEFAEISGNGTTAILTIKGAGAVTVKAIKASDGNYNAKVDTQEIIISKATVSADDFDYEDPDDLVYNKTAKAATVNGDAAYGAITIHYYYNREMTNAVTDPINVGTYYVGITTAGGSNYEAVTAPMYVSSFTITARIVTVTADAKTMQYGDDVPTLTYTHNLIAGDSFTGSLETEATKTSDVGEYDITIGDLANSNYTISFTGAKLTITQADGPAAPTVTGSYVDNGMTYTYTVNAISGAEYSMDGTTWQDSNVFENLVAGQKYTFYARIKETKNVMAGAIGTSAEVDLSKLPGKGTVTIADWTFGEDAKAPVTNSTTGSSVDSYLYESIDGKGYSSANAPTNAGEYKLTVTFKETATHNGTTAYDTFTIAKATPVVDVPTGLKATYGDTLADVQLPTGWTWKDAGTTEVGNAGENSFTVIYTKDDSGNYNTVEKTVTITVAPKVVTATVTVAGENFIFNGSEQKPGVTVKDGENTIPESEYTVTYANNTNAGTATVTITDKDGGNYTVTGETTFAIAKKASSALSGVEREFMRTIATTGNEIDVEAMLPDDHGTVTYTITSNGYTVLENVAVDANGKLVFDTKSSAAATSDTITVKVEMQNYTDVTLTVSVILNDKAPQEITGVTAQTDLIYNGEAQKGYTGTPASDYTGAYEITYTGRDNSYNSSAAPVGAGDYTVTFKIPDSDLYYSGNISINFTIGKAQATVTADDKEAYIGSRMPELTYKVSGLIGNDTISVELSCDANMNRAGETPIVVTATDPNGNYEITTVNGTLTVEYFPYIPIITPTYPPVVNSGDNGNVVVSPMKPEKGDTVTIIPNPDSGYEVDEIIVTDKNGNPVTVVDNGGGTYSFKQPSGKVNIEVTFKEIIKVCPGDKTCPMYGYTDLDMTAWYHDGVHFCIENKLMNGTSTTTFAPGATTNRAMIVTILWRLAGEPVVNYAMSFEDVAADTWYTEAIRWAASEGIVNGYSDTAFGPNDNITREQLATILYRYEQKNGGGFKGMWMIRMDYVDLADVSDWAYEAMCWMNMNSIVNGRPGKILDPKGSATRAEAATMLYRYCDSIGKEE